ncbi:unnamed protein product [Closterium sp. NIES-53]
MKQEATRGLQGVASRRRAGGRGSWRAEIGTVAKLLDFAAACSLDYTTALVAASASASPPSVTGECALGTDVLEDKQEDFECLAAAVPRFASMLLAPEGEPDAPDIPTPRSYAEAILGPYSSQWQAAMDAEMASWKSTGTYVDEVPPPGVNIVDGMWIFRASASNRELTTSIPSPPSPKMNTLRVLLHIAAQRDYELHSLDFSTAFLQGSLHEEIWLRRPPGFTETTLAALRFAPATADPSLFLRTDTSLPPFYVLVYVDDLVFATADTEALTLVKSELQNSHTCTDLGELHSYLGLQITRDRARRTITLTQSHMVHQVLQRFGFQFSSPQPTPLSTSHLLSAPPSDESVEPSGLYPELVGCLMYLMTSTRTNFAYPLNLLARYVAPATQRSSKGYTFSLGSGFVSWRSTRSSLVLSSSCEAEIYAGAMAAQELRWLTYLLTNLGEQPHSPPQCGQLRLAYVATRANTADIFTKAFPPGAGAGGTGTKGTSAGSAGARGVRHGDPGARAGGTGAGGAGAGGTGVVDPGAGGAGAGGAASGGAGAAGTVQRRPFFVPPLPSSLPPPDTVLRQVLLSSFLACSRCSHWSSGPRVPSTHVMTLRPSSVPLRVPLPPPPQSSLPAVLDPESDLARAASPSVPHLLATVVTDRSFESTAAFALVAELIDFAAAFRLDYATNLVAQCESDCLPSVKGDCALGMNVLEDRHEELQLLYLISWPCCLPLRESRMHQTSRPRALTQRRLRVPTPLSGRQPWTQRWHRGSPQAPTVKRPPGTPLVFKARYVARGFSQRQGVDFFHTFSPTRKMTTTLVLLHVAAQRDYELHSLDFNTAFLQGSLHEEIWLRHPPGFTGSFPADTQWSLRRPVYTHSEHKKMATRPVHM